MSQRRWWHAGESQSRSSNSSIHLARNLSLSRRRRGRPEGRRRGMCACACVYILMVLNRGGTLPPSCARDVVSCLSNSYTLYIYIYIYTLAIYPPSLPFSAFSSPRHTVFTIHVHTHIWRTPCFPFGDCCPCSYITYIRWQPDIHHPTVCIYIYTVYVYICIEYVCECMRVQYVCVCVYGIWRPAKKLRRRSSVEHN